MTQSQRARELLAALESRPDAWVSVPVKGASTTQGGWKLALNLTGVGALIGAKPDTVVRYRGRYGPDSEHPFPAHDGRLGRTAYWWPERADEIIDWKSRRPGQGAGGGAGQHAARAERLPEFDAARPRHAAVTGEHCVWCARLATGVRPRCPGLSAKRAARLAGLLSTPAAEASEAELATEMRDGLVVSAQRGLSSRLTLSPVGRRWLQVYHQLHPDSGLPAETAPARRPQPRYLQIAEDLAARIADGQLAPGQRLPSVRELAREYEVSMTSIQQALVVLRTRGTIEMVLGRGNFVPTSTG